MSQREAHKRREVSIEEEKDFYLSFLNKKLRNARKKLEQIDELSKKDAKTLKPEQIEKINSRPDVVQTVTHFEELKDLYYSAYKIGLEEGKITPKESSIEKNGKSTDKNGKSEKTANQTDISKDEIIKDTLQKVLNLVAFSQSLENPLIKEGLQGAERASFEGIQQFCQGLLNFTTEGDINQRQAQSLEKLVSYVKSEDIPAFGENSYKNIQETVERALTTSTFENIIAAQKEKVNKAETEEEVEAEKIEIVEQLPTGAAVLKPDSGDVNISPEKAQYIPKVVRFVDEIEKDLLQTAQIPDRVDGPDTSKGVLKETKESVDKNQNEEEREDGQGNQEQKSFRKKRYNDEYGQSKYYNNDRRPQSGRGGSYQKRGYSGHKENNKYHEGRNYSKGSDDYYQNRVGSQKYQIKQYVEKKPQEA